MALDTALSLSAVLVLCIISGLADAQGFVYASHVWRDNGVAWTPLVRSSFGFAVGIGSYWCSIPFMNRIGLATADLQFLVWFLVTLIGVAVATGSIRRWSGTDLVVSVVVVAGLCWLGVTSASSDETSAELRQKEQQCRNDGGAHRGADVNAA